VSQTNGAPSQQETSIWTKAAFAMKSRTPALLKESMATSGNAPTALANLFPTASCRNPKARLMHKANCCTMLSPMVAFQKMEDVPNLVSLSGVIIFLFV
jgi:hypothetical protein